MIIICHICQKYDLEMMYWFNAGVQIFLFMSGWLYGKKKINDSVGFLKKNLLKVLLDYWMYLLIMILIYFVFARDEITVGMAVNALVGAGTITGMGHLWFIPYIVCCYVLTPFLYAVSEKMAKRNKWVYGVSALSICAIVFLYGHFYRCYFNTAWINCYILGYFMMKAKQVYMTDENFYLRIVTPVFLLSNGIKIYAEYVKSFSGMVARLYGVFLPYCHVTLGIFLFFLLFCLGKNGGIGTGNVGRFLLKISDRYSYQVYICHGFFILSSFSLLGKDIFPFGIELLIILIFTMASAVVLEWCSSKIKRKI